MRLPQPVSSAINQVARTALGKEWALYGQLLNHWAEIVGPDYAKDTAPVKITFPRGKKNQEQWAQANREGGTLTISLPPGLTLTFSHRTEIILARLNAFFGYQAIDRISLKPTYGREKAAEALPLPPLSNEEKTALDGQIKSIENNDLKEALQQLGASVLANQKKL